MRYIVKRYYKAGPVEYQAGQVIVIDDPEYAAWLARDMRGFLELVLPPVATIPEPAISALTTPEVEIVRHVPTTRKPRKAKG
jgi:hypothetical protein